MVVPMMESSVDDTKGTSACILSRLKPVQVSELDCLCCEISPRNKCTVYCEDRLCLSRSSCLLKSTVHTSINTPFEAVKSTRCACASPLFFVLSFALSFIRHALFWWLKGAKRSLRFVPRALDYGRMIVWCDGMKNSSSWNSTGRWAVVLAYINQLNHCISLAPNS